MTGRTGCRVRLLALLPALAVLATPLSGRAAPQQQCAVVTALRLDHVPIAVRDLAAAGELFRRLGFTLKPGRPHDNGIANLHAKFRDGTELELITAPEAVDSISLDYVKFLRQGDGAAFLALHAGPLDAVEQALRPLTPGLSRLPGMLVFPREHSWGRIFFGMLNRSPTDRPEHLVHANGATSLRSVWWAGEAAREIATALGATACGSRWLAGIEADAERWPLAANSELLLLAPTARLLAARPIVGVTVAVEDVAAAGALLRDAGIDLTESTGTGGRSVWIRPSIAPGLWIELREGD